MVGTGIIFIGYALLPEAYRFSRALILLGMGWIAIAYLISRLTLHIIGIKAYNLNPDKSKRIAIIGTSGEYERVNNLLKQTSINSSFIGFISADKNGTNHANYVGTIEQIEEVIEIYKINEVIFCVLAIFHPKESLITCIHLYLLMLILKLHLRKSFHHWK
ncbi:MAG: hypothetical protein IPH89_08885 [Bacteroidetes bacterium]|nr:hypothetical protein [Bacteroidota bacterium]